MEDGYKPLWAFPWPAAVMLVEHVLQSARVRPGRALELGAGLGIVGIALTLAGHRVIVTDYDEDALAFAHASAALNGVRLCETRRLDWRQPPQEQFDLIVASEVAFDHRHHVPVVGLLSKCLAPEGQAFISDTNRDAAEGFPAVVAAAGLACTVARASARAIPAFDAVDGRVFKGRVFCIRRGGADERA